MRSGGSPMTLYHTPNARTQGQTPDGRKHCSSKRLASKYDQDRTKRKRWHSRCAPGPSHSNIGRYKRTSWEFGYPHRFARNASGCLSSTNRPPKTRKGEDRVFHSVTFERRYKKGENEWASSQS